MSLQLVEQLSDFQGDGTLDLDMTFTAAPSAGDLLILAPFYVEGVLPSEWTVPAGFELVYMGQSGHSWTRASIFAKVSDGTEQTLTLSQSKGTSRFGAFAYNLHSTTGGVRFTGGVDQDEGSDDAADGSGDYIRTVTTLPSNPGDLVVGIATASGGSSFDSATWDPTPGLAIDTLNTVSRGQGTLVFESAGNDTMSVTSQDIGGNIRFALYGLAFEEIDEANPGSPTFRSNLSNVPTPKSEWRFDATFGGTDVTGVRNAVLAGTADTTGLHFESDGAQDFQTDGVATIPKTTPVLPHTGDFSLEWSSGPLSLDFGRFFAASDALDNGGVALWYRDTGDLSLKTYSGGTRYEPATDPVVDASVGHHFVLTKAGTQWKLYVDNVLELDVSLAYTPYLDEDFLWGNRASRDGALRPPGVLDEAAVWHETLDATAVGELYTAYEEGASAGSVLALDQATLKPGDTVSGSYSGYISEPVGPLVLSDGNPNPIEVALTFSNAAQDGDSLWSGDFTGTMPSRPADEDSAPWASTGTLDVTLDDPGA